MEETIEKKVRIVGDALAGKNYATITEERRNPNSISGLAAKDLIERSGKMHMPLGSKYLGSAVVHYYETESQASSNPQFFTAQHVNIAKVSEHHADWGWKQLKNALMKAYGRKEPETRS